MFVVLTAERLGDDRVTNQGHPADHGSWFNAAVKATNEDEELRNALRQPWIEGQPGVKRARKEVARLETGQPPPPKRGESPSAYLARVKGLDAKLVAAREELDKQQRRAAKIYDKSAS